MTEYRAYPLQWPDGLDRTPERDRETARFSKQAYNARGYHQAKPLTVAQARDRLMSEIRSMTKAGQTWRVDPAQVVISTNIRTRNDGLPYSNAREPDDPGVCVYFYLDGEPHAFPCDKWDRAADNIAAIAAHIGAMRGIERWGVGDLRAAFAGFKALPPSTAGGRTVERWHDVLGVDQREPKEVVRSAYRSRRRRAHPDHPDGSEAEFQRVQDAWAEYERVTR